jgi:hypothetical protein
MKGEGGSGGDLSVVKTAGSPHSKSEQFCGEKIENRFAVNQFL